MESHDVLHGSGKSAGRVVVAKVLLCHKRQLADVCYALYILGFHSSLVHALAIECYVVVCVLYNLY